MSKPLTEKILDLLDAVIPVSRKKWAADLTRRDDYHAEDLKRHRDIARREIDQTKEAVERILDKVAEINWSRPPDSDVYELRLTLDPRAFGGLSRHSHDLEIMAELIARRVRGEIATSRFVHRASEYDRARESARMLESLHTLRQPDRE